MFNDTLKSLLMTHYNVNLIGSQNFTIIDSSASYLSVLILKGHCNDKVDVQSWLTPIFFF